MNRQPAATYRVQLGPEFGLEALVGRLDFLRELGISHVYLSPVLQAAPGSEHGYDVVDPSRVSEELGGEEAFARLVAEVQRRGLGILLDIVPNHAALALPDNRALWDVLENGAASRFAPWFDIDWQRPVAGPEHRIVLPILGERYATLLARGEVVVAREGPRFTLELPGWTLPLAPESLVAILERAHRRGPRTELLALADELARLPRPGPEGAEEAELRHARLLGLRGRLARLLEQPELAATVDSELKLLCADPEAMDAIVLAQRYRPVYWRSGERELNYRRFFDIDTLIGVRVEHERVFELTHERVLRAVREGHVDGLRVDHCDGLRDPGGYFERLRRAAPDAWILAEKILARSERLPEAWPIDGTTGYEFLDLAGGLLVDPRGGPPLERAFAEWTGERRGMPEIAGEAGRRLLDTVFASDLDRLADLAARIAEGDWRTRDLGREELRRALRGMIAELPVYRTYVRPEQETPRPEDAAAIARAVSRARALDPELEAEPVELLRQVLLLERRGPLEEELAARFQQLSPAITAKAVEDTALYRYHPLGSLCEVGADPATFGVEPASFHEAMALAAAWRPLGLLSLSTHDTKRGEDVRARLALLSEVPKAWLEALRRWSETNARHRTGGRPDRRTEWLLYQTLVGAWPIETERVQAFARKAAREAELRTSWRRPDRAFEDALEQFVERALSDPSFTSDLDRFVSRLIVPGRTNSLVQKLLCATAPGVPDVYQGTELWESSLVDPDNRRPVDYEQRARLLAELDGLELEDVLERAELGLPKLLVVRRAIELRHRRPAAFAPGSSYLPLEPRGERAMHALAFLREGEGARFAVCVPRLVLGLGGAFAGDPARGGFQDETLELPEGLWRDAFGGGTREGGEVLLADLFARFPVALLEALESPSSR